MLDSILTGDGAANIDWLHVRRMLDRGFTRFLNALVPATVFITPLLVVGFGYGAEVIRMLVLFFLVALGWLAWLARSVVRRKIVWHKSAAGWGGGLLIIAVFLSSFQNGAWGLDGAISATSLFGWLAAVGLALLIVQHVLARPQRLSALFAAFAASSGLLALLSLAFSAVNQTPVAVYGSFLSQAFFAAIGAVVSFGLWRATPPPVFRRGQGGGYVTPANATLPPPNPLLGKGGGIRWLWLAALFLNLAALAVLAFPLIRTPEARPQTVPFMVSTARFFQHNTPETIAFGAGLGREVERFWERAELADMRAITFLPPLGSSFAGVLWSGGVVALAALIMILASIAVGVWRSRVLRRRAFETPRRGRLYVASVPLVGFVLSLALFAFTPLSATSLFTLFLFVGLAAAVETPRRGRLYAGASTTPDSHSTRTFALAEGGFALSLGRFAIAAGVIGLVLYTMIAVSLVRGRLQFVNAVTVSDSGTTVDTGMLREVIEASPRTHAYRSARAGFFTQSILEAPDEAASETLNPSLNIIAEDLAILASAPSDSVGGGGLWTLAWNAERVGSFLSARSEAAAQAEEGVASPRFWFARAQELYERALVGLSRNVILYTDVARFLRGRAALLADEGAAPEPYYEQALQHLDRAIAIDPTYEAARFEKSELLSLLGRSEEAIEAVRSLAAESAAGAYQAGRLALNAQKLEEARGYFQQAIAVNGNHLQARYDLVQVLLALSDREGAKRELNALAERIPEDDFQSKALVEGLRSLLGE